MNRCGYVKVFVILMVACCFLFQDAAAQNQPASEKNKVSFGAGLTMKYPYESFGDEYNTGFGIMGFLDYPLIPLLELTAGIGWNHFDNAQAPEAVDIWEYVGGLRLALGVFFMSGEVGYFTEVNSTSFLPGLGVRFHHFELAVNLRSVPSGSWTGFRLGYYF